MIDAHYSNGVANLINHAIVADADSPVVVAAGQLSASGRPWILGERLNRSNDSVFAESFLRSLSAARSRKTRYMIILRGVRQGNLQAGGSEASCGARA